MKFKLRRDNFAPLYIGNINKKMDRHPQQIKRERQDKNRRERNIKNLSRQDRIEEIASANFQLHSPSPESLIVYIGDVE